MPSISSGPTIAAIWSGNARSDQPARSLGIRIRDPLRERAVARALRHGSHEVHHGVDETPREVAAERGHHDGARLVLPGGRDRQGADDGDGHDQAEQDLRDPVDRVEQPLSLVAYRGFHDDPLSVAAHQSPPPQRVCHAIPRRSKLLPVRADTPLLA